MTCILAHPISADAFAPFGNLIETGTKTPTLINEGQCKRFTDLASIDIRDGHAGLSLFQANLRALPYSLTMMERHPLGSQCFIPQSGSEYLVIVAEDSGDRPGVPQAFTASAFQSVNIGRNVWHGVLAPIAGSGLFAVVDRIGDGANLQEYWFDAQFTVHLPS